MSKIQDAVKNMTWGGRIVTLILIAGLLLGARTAYNKLVPKKAKNARIVTKATGLPPLPYDKASSAPVRTLPEFNEPATIEGLEIRGELMGWNAQMGIMYAVGGRQTSVGSLCEESKLNVHLDVQNNTGKQGEDLYAFAEALHSGEANPSKGCHFIAWMGDGCPNYFAGLNARLKKDFGDDYGVKIVTFGGASFGEDKWMLKPKFSKDARGSLTCTVIRDGDWNIAVIKSQANGWDINTDQTTYDPTKVNFVSAPSDDYMEAVKFYTTGQKVTLKLVKNGKISGDTTLACSGVATWFPGDYEAVKQKGGLVTVASTADYGAQMANAVIFINKWAADNRTLVEKFVEAVGKGGDQVKSHDEALRFASQVSEVVYADREKTADDWYNAYKSFEVTDDDGNVIKVGGSRVFNLADVAAYTGVSGGSDKYRTIYNTFGNICKEAYPEVLSQYPAYEDVTDWTYLKAVYLKNKDVAGTVSKKEFTASDNIREVVGDRSYSIEFETGSAVLRPSSYKVLDDIASQITIQSNLLVEVSGHTDNTGNSSNNLTLSEMRAKAVKDYIVNKDPSDFSNRIKAKGYGQEKPIADNSTADGRQRNRRVEIKVGRN